MDSAAALLSYTAENKIRNEMERGLSQEWKGIPMSRRKLREQIFKILFCKEFYNGEGMKEQLALFLEHSDPEQAPGIEQHHDYIRHKISRIIDHLNEIDQQIEDASKGWKLSRMGKVDLALLRLAVYEMKFEEDIPVGVAINEAVELAKRYGTDDSSSFINGILAKLA